MICRGPICDKKKSISKNKSFPSFQKGFHSAFVEHGVRLKGGSRADVQEAVCVSGQQSVLRLSAEEADVGRSPAFNLCECAHKNAKRARVSVHTAGQSERDARASVTRERRAVRARHTKAPLLAKWAETAVLVTAETYLELRKSLSPSRRTFRERHTNPSPKLPSGARGKRHRESEAEESRK